MKRSALIFVGALVSAVAVHAKTVLWYHFDEAEPGTVTTDSSVIVDAAGTQNGVPEYWWNNGKSTNANYMPAYSNAFPSGRHWVDPKTGVKGTLNRCLQIVNPDTRYEWGNGEHGVVRIPDDKAFHLQTFTIECFVKDLYSVDEIAKGQGTRFVLSKKNSWSMGIPAGTGNGSRALNGSVSYDKDGVSTSWSNGMNANCLPRGLRDGNWHHLAIVVDGSDPAAVKVSYYQDYHLLMTSGTMEKCGPVFYDESPIFLGRQDGISNYGWNGLIDELRISDVALDPEEFLRFANDVADADTVVFYSFDKWFGNPFEMSPAWGEYCNYFVNETPFVNPPKAVLTPREKATIPVLTSEGAGTVRNGIASSAAVVDLGSISAVTNGNGQAFGFVIDTTTPEQLYTAGDFTAEGFVKFNSLPDSTDYIFRGTLTQGGKENVWLVTVDQDGNLRYGINWEKNISTSTAVLSDFGWHHVAVVSMPAAKMSRFYVDYRLVDTIADGEHYILSDSDTTARLYMFSYSVNGQGNFCPSDAHASDFRITKRALEPQEFLTTRSPATAVLASASFENGLSEGPADLSDLFAVGTLTGTGGYAASRPFKSAENKKSIRLEGATVNLGRNLLLERKDVFTLEFFLRPETLRGTSSVVSLKKPAPSDEDVWSVSLSADKRTLVVGAGDDTASFALSEVADWWHHYGLVFAEEDGIPVVTLYVDHVQVGEPTALASAFDYSALSRGLVVGSANLTGWIDEIRITKGALATADMMACGPRLGFLLLLK